MIFYKDALSKAGLLMTMLDRRESGQAGIILFSSATHLNAELAPVLHSFTPSSASPFLTRGETFILLLFFGGLSPPHSYGGNLVTD